MALPTHLGAPIRGSATRFLVHLTALADAGWAYHGSVGNPIALTRANPCCGDADLGEMSFEWAMAASAGACVPASAPACSLVNPTDGKPRVRGAVRS